MNRLLAADKIHTGTTDRRSALEGQEVPLPGPSPMRGDGTAQG